MAAPTISYERYLNLGFDATGGTKEFTVTYTNTQTKYVNKPVVGDGTITVVSSSATDTTVTVTYSLTVYSSTYLKTVPIAFSCMNPDDGLVTTDVLYYTVGDTPMNELGSGCYIVFDTPALIFESTGGTQFYSLEAGYPDTDNSINIKVRNSNGVYPISWCKDELEGGGYADDGTSVEETHSVIMSAMNGITEPFIACVTASYTNYYNETTGNTLYAVIKAANGEAVDTDPSVEAYTTSIKCTSAGTNDFSSSINYINVMYKNVEINDIATPTVSSSWFRFNSMSLQSQTDGEILMRYFWTCDENISSVARTCTVTFTADGATARTTVTQAMAAADDGEEETPDIPVEGGAYIGQIWRDVEYSFGNIPTVNYSIYKGDVLIFKGRSVLRPNTQNNIIMVNKICQNYIENPTLKKDAVSQSFEIVPFYLKNGDGTVTYKTFYFVNDWSYSDDFRVGVLQHPILNRNTVYRHQWMPFSVFAFGDRQIVRYGVHYKAGATDEYGNIIPDWGNTLYVTNEITTEYFIRSRNSYPEEIDTIYIGDKEWKVVDDCKVRYVLYYMNPWGGYDWFPIEGRTVINDEITPYKIQNNYNNQTLQFGKQRYLAEINRTYQMSTGWLSQEESDRMWYLLESNTVYMQDLWENKMYPVVINDTSVEHKERTLLSSRIRYTINVELSQTMERK